MNSESKCLYSFLCAIHGNWRNAVYLICSTCPYLGQACGGHLLSADADGTPILFSVSQFERLTGETVEMGECAGTLSREAFECLYHMWLLWNTDTGTRCSIQQILQNAKQSNAQS